MRIPAEADFGACEDAIADLQGQGGSEPLTIPTHLKYLAAGGEASWAQFLVSWACTPGPRILNTFAESETDGQVSDFTRRLYGLIGACCATRIIARDGTTELTDVYRAAAFARLEALQSRDPSGATRGPSIEVAAADHLSRSTPVFLYHRSPDGGKELRPRDHFVRLAAYLLKQTSPLRANQFAKMQAERAIGNLLYELFKNTEDHALTDSQGNILPLSFRVLQASNITQDMITLTKSAGDFGPLAEYFSRHSPAEGKTQIPFFCLSVLDSGPGFAQSLTGTPLSKLSLADEYVATLECFRAGTRKNHTRFGKGLPLVRSLLRSTDGFLRLRTGRLSLVYDSAADVGDPDSPMPLTPWTGREAVAPVVGTLLTLIIPLGTVS